MINKNLFILLIFFGMSLNSCTSFNKTLGLEKDVPNEFLIEKRDPLTLPPDYNVIPPGSSSKKDENKKSTSSLSSIFDKDLDSKKKSSSKNVSDNPQSIENEILKKIN